MKNLYKGWKTTVIGLVILLASIASVFFAQNVNWMDASIGIAIGLGMLFVPDTIISKLSDFLGKKTSTNETPCNHHNPDGHPVDQL